MKIIFICTGNTCRSPMAEAYIKNITGKDSFMSAGIDAIDGISASENSIITLKNLDINLENHRAKRVTVEQLKKADLILTMTFSHKKRLIEYYPQFEDRIYTLKEYARGIDATAILCKIEKMEHDILKKRELFLEDDKEINKELENEFFKSIQSEVEVLNDLYKSLNDIDIKDPFGGTLKEYKQSFDEIKFNVDLLLKKLDLG